ncbi:MAG: protein serine/threonine phosphatase [Frankiales bacterium]|jgi:serine/threonine protein phosphatase PrpC|nr:protein serine/threonine phosphatase [Frankiales bacterium]
MTLALQFAARSHTGLLRDGNEDSVYAGPRLLAVADGMGGHAAGEVASAVAIAALAPLDEDAPGADLLDDLRQAAVSANTHLRDMVEGDAALEGMGTTLTAILSAGNRLGLLHIGDSRAYLLRDGELTQITRDHTLVQALIDEGRISEEEASTHPQRNVITNVLDGRPGLDLDLSVREVRAGDRYLLCSDGLTGPVASNDTLRDALALPDVQDAVDRLVQLALRGGGPDNVTAIVAEAVETDHAPALTPVVAGAAAESPQAPPPGVAESAAGRARTAEGRDVDEPARPPDSAPAAPPSRHGRRLGIVAVIAGLLVLVGAGASWAYVRSQYYVGAENEHVAVFRGVAGSVAGMDLSSVEEVTTLETSLLGELDAARVQKGIVAKDKEDAHRIVERLQTQVPVCPAPAPAVTLPESPLPSAPAAAASAAPVPTPVPSPLASTPASPTPCRTP